MKIVFVANMPRKGYSGGRYCAFVMAECLAAKEHSVYFITDAIPEFEKDFKKWPGHKNICFILTRGLEIGNRKLGKCDYTIVIPTLNPDERFCERCKKIVSVTDSQMAVVNFETPNWYNEYAENKRPITSLFLLKNMVNEYHALIISCTNEGMKYAKRYYFEEDKKFVIWNPAINTIVADSIGKIHKEKRIICFIRLGDKHKGGEDLLNILDQPLSGYTVVLVVGNGKIYREYRARLVDSSKKNQYKLEIKYSLTDKEKFIELKRAEILLFPSRFEGYGYPPIEAIYCNTICITYDLPVLREISGEKLIYCNYADSDDIKTKLKKIINHYSSTQILWEQNILHDNMDWRVRAHELEKILENRLQKIQRDNNYVKNHYKVSLKLLFKEYLKYIAVNLKI